MSNDEQKIKAALSRLYTVEQTTPDFMLRSNGKYIFRTLVADLRSILRERSNVPERVFLVFTVLGLAMAGILLRFVYWAMGGK